MIDAGFRTVSLDLRGHGESSTGWSDLSTEAIASDVLTLIDHLACGRALLVGTSLGAVAAVCAAATAPAAVRGLVLITPPVRDRARLRLDHALVRVALRTPWGLALWMRYWESLFPAAKPVDAAAYAARLRRNLAEPRRLATLRSMMLGPANPTTECRTRSVHSPVLVLTGTDHRRFRRSEGAAKLVAAKLVAERLHGQITVIQGAGHYPHVEFPDRTAQIVVDFCNAVTR